MEKAYLVLSDGSVFEGQSLGVKGTVTAQLDFTPAVVGYMEAITCEDFSGKILAHTFPLIGNYGAIDEEANGEPTVAGLIVRECCSTPSNSRMESDFNGYLIKKSVIGIAGIDTRSLRKKARAAKLTAMIAPDKTDVEGKVKKLREIAKARKGDK